MLIFWHFKLLCSVDSRNPARAEALVDQVIRSVKRAKEAYCLLVACLVANIHRVFSFSDGVTEFLPHLREDRQLSVDWSLRFTDSINIGNALSKTNMLVFSR